MQGVRTFLPLHRSTPYWKTLHLSYSVIRLYPSNTAKHKTMELSRGIILLVLFSAGLIQNTAIGTGATNIVFTPRGTCVAPGDAVELDCTLRAASDKKTPIEFFFGSNRIDDNGTDDYTVLALNTFCRWRDSDNSCKWDINARLTIHATSARDEGVYWCKAVDNGRSYNASAKVFVQSQTEFELPASRTANLGEEVTVAPERKCDTREPVSVTRTGVDGNVQELPFRYKRYNDSHQDAFVSKRDGKLVIAVFKCTDVGTYTFTVMARRGFQPVSTSKSVYIKASCGDCCPVVATTLTTGGLETSDAGTNSSNRSGPKNKQNQTTDNTALIVFIVILAVLVFVGPIAVYFWQRRKGDSHSPNEMAQNDGEADKLNDTANSTA